VVVAVVVVVVVVVVLVYRHLFVVEQDPLPLLLHVRHVMPALGVSAHVADDGQQAVLSYVRSVSNSK
jgi:hypothetical protein